MLPTFIIIGAAKAGTTSLWKYLKTHPAIFMTSPKETHFFSHGWERGVDHYCRLFEGAGTATARGEASTSYSQVPHVVGVPSRIAAVVPDVKLIYIIRDPVERIRSQYAHFVDRGREERPINVAVREDRVYLDTCRYATQIEAYLEFFSAERLLVLTAEQLRHARWRTITRVFEFVGVRSDVKIENIAQESNRTDEKRRAPNYLNTGRRISRRTFVGKSIARSAAGKHIRRLLTRPIEPAELDISPDLKAHIHNALADEWPRLRALVGPEVELWTR